MVKFFKSMGPDYGPRINDVLKSYMHARLAGVIRGAETLDHYRNREGVHDGPKPQFGDLDREIEAIVAKQSDLHIARAKAQEVLQQKFAVDGGTPDEGVRPWVR